MKSQMAALFVFCLAFPAMAQWTPVSSPGQFDPIGLYLPGEDRLFAGGSTSKVYGSMDHGASWQEIAGGLDEAYAPIRSMAMIGDFFLMSRDFFGTFNYRSLRQDGQWQAWEALPYQDGSLGDLTVIGGSVFAVFPGGSVRRSDDHGSSWTPLTIPGAPQVWRLFACEGRLFASQNQINSGQIYRSDDLGSTWTPVGSGLGSSYLCSHVYWQNRLLLCVYHMGGIGSFWSSEDFGDNWEPVTTLPTPYNINGLAEAGDGRLAIGASGSYGQASIWLSADLVSWENFTGNLPQAAQPFNDLVSHDGWFFKTGGTVTSYRAPHPEPSGLDDSPTSAFTSALSAWPNPFNPQTTLRFELAQGGRVQLAVFDLAGRCVASIFRGHLAAGTHTFSWQAGDAPGRPLPSGIYMARLSTAAGTATQKLVLTK